MVTKETVLTWLLGIAAFFIFLLLIIFVFPPEWQEVLLDEQYFWLFVTLIFVGMLVLAYGIKKLVSR